MIIPKFALPDLLSDEFERNGKFNIFNKFTIGANTINYLSKSFEERVKGSHQILTMGGIEEILNIQAKSGKAKPYQVKQMRNIIVKNQLKLDGGEN